MCAPPTGWWTMPSAWWRPADAHDHEMDRVRRMLEKDYTIPKKVVEINPPAPAGEKSGRPASRPADSDDLVNSVIEQLFESALLVEGLLPNPADMVRSIQKLMEAATKRNCYVIRQKKTGLIAPDPF